MRIVKPAGKPILLDELAEITPDKSPGEEIEPNGLSAIMQAREWTHRRLGRTLHLHHGLTLDFGICYLASASAFAGVKQNFVSRSLSGAEEPKVCIPIPAPVAPTGIA